MTSYRAACQSHVSSVGLPSVELYAARGGQPSRLRDAFRREIERLDRQAALGEKDPVASLAVAGDERAPSRLKRQRREERVRRLAIGEVRAGVALIPERSVGHQR